MCMLVMHAVHTTKAFVPIFARAKPLAYITLKKESSTSWPCSHAPINELKQCAVLLDGRQRRVEARPEKCRLSKPEQRLRMSWKLSAAIRIIRSSKWDLLACLTPFCFLPPTTATHCWWLASNQIAFYTFYTSSISPTAYKGFSSFQPLSNVSLCQATLCTASSALYEATLLLCCSFPAITAFSEMVLLCPWSGLVCLFTPCSVAQFICIHLWS